MNSPTHFIFPFFICLVLYKLQIISLRFAIIAGLIGVFVDIDHYIEHIILSKKNKFSIVDTWNNSEHFHRFAQRSIIHHTEGATIITVVLLLLALIYPTIALIIAIAYYSHLYLDHIWINKPHYLQLKVGKLYYRETHFEVFLDICLIIACILIFYL